MGWRQRSERGWDRIAAEHVIMVPETHGLTVDDQVMLHPLGLSPQLGIAHDVGTECLVGRQVADSVMLQSSHGRLDDLTQPRHVTQ